MSFRTRASIGKLWWKHPSLQAHRIHKPLTPADEALRLVLLLRAWKHKSELCRPDCWLDLSNNRVYSRPRAGAVALCPGDVLHSEIEESIVLHVIWHEVVYVGRGCYVDFGASTKVTVHSFLDTPEKLWIAPRQDSNVLSPKQRWQRVWRTLSSCGFYKYNSRSFNCQHFVNIVVRGDLPGVSSKGTNIITSCAVGLSVFIGCAALQHLIPRKHASPRGRPAPGGAAAHRARPVLEEDVEPEPAHHERDAHAVLHPAGAPLQ